MNIDFFLLFVYVFLRKVYSVATIRYWNHVFEKKERSFYTVFNVVYVGYNIRKLLMLGICFLQQTRSDLPYIQYNGSFHIFFCFSANTIFDAAFTADKLISI